LLATLGGLFKVGKIALEVLVPLWAMIFFMRLAGIINEDNEVKLADQLLASLCKYAEHIVKIKEIMEPSISATYHQHYSSYHIDLIKHQLRLMTSAQQVFYLNSELEKALNFID